MLVATAGEYVIGLEGHVAPELPLHANGGLPAVPDFRQLPRRRCQFHQVADQASWCIVVGVAEKLRGLIEWRQRPVERVRREIGAAIVIRGDERDRRR